MMKATKLITGLLATTLIHQGRGFIRTPLLASAARPYSGSLTAFRKAGQDNFPAIRPFFGRELDDVFSVFDEMDNILPRPFDRRVFNRAIAMDLKETNDSYELIVDLPGIDPKEIDIKVRGNDLTISAHRESHKKEEGTTFHRVERSSGHVTRTVSLPDDADVDSITAENQHGVLHVKVKKTNEGRQMERKIEVKNLPETTATEVKK